VGKNKLINNPFAKKITIIEMPVLIKVIILRKMTVIIFYLFVFLLARLKAQSSEISALKE